MLESVQSCFELSIQDKCFITYRPFTAKVELFLGE